MEEMDIYSAIFDITTQNMEDAEKHFHLPKEAFLFMVEDVPQSADIFKISKETENNIFLEKAYLTCLKRICDETAFQNWQKRFSLPRYEFQRVLIVSLLNSAEYNGKHVKAWNNIYSQRNIFGGNLTKAQPSGGLNIPEKLLKFYRKQPKFLRKIERKILGVDK